MYSAVEDEMETTILILVATAVVLVSAWIFSFRKSKGKPLPGPKGLPFVGYLPFMTKKPYVKFTELAKKYGPVYRVKLGGQNIVVLSDFNSIKEAFAMDAFMGRPPDLPFDLTEDNIRTGAFLGMPWKEHRRVTMHMLRDLGFGKTRMEEHMKEEILELLQRMESLEGTPTKMSDLLAPSISNNIASLIFGRRLKYDDPKRQKLDKLLSETGKLAGALAWQLFFPWIRAVMEYLNIGNKGKLTKVLAEVKAYCWEELKEHVATLDPNNIRDFMDGYLLEIEKRKVDPNSSFTESILVDLAQAFFGAGSETVRISLDWLLLMNAAFPEVQEEVQKEIDDVIGRDRFPTRADSLKMPYTEATILEIMRWRTSVPVNLMRYTLKDTELNGYFIPKHSPVVAILWAAHNDKNLWGEDVDVFRPERFLSEDGKKIVKPEYFIPFSIGKRACPGKSVAEIEVFLYYTVILQKFKFSLPPGKEADFEGILGIGLQPKRQDIIFERR